MKERTRKIFIMIVMAALIVSLMAASFAALTYGRYSGGRFDENSPYEDYIDFVGATAYEVSSPEELVNAINNGYSYIKIAADAEKPFVVNNLIANVYTNLVIDVNGNTVIRNSRNPLLDVRRSISVVLVYDSSTDADGGFYNPVGSALQTSGGTLTVGEGVYESGPKIASVSSVTEEEIEDVFVRDGARGSATAYRGADGAVWLPKLTGDVYLENNVTEGYLRNDTYLLYTVEKNGYVDGGQLYVNAKKDVNGIVTSAEEFSPICNVASCDFYYYYPVSEANEDGFYTYAVVYGYHDVKALASNKNDAAKTLQKSGLVWPYAAIRSVEDEDTQEGGVTHARGGAFTTNFGTDNTYGILSVGGEMTVGTESATAPPTFTAVGEGTCIGMSAQTGDTLTIASGTFTSEVGDTILMRGGEMTVTGGTFTKSGNKARPSDGLEAIEASRTALIHMLGGELTIDGTVTGESDSRTYSVNMTAGSTDAPLTNVFGIYSTETTDETTGKAVEGTVTISGCKITVNGTYSAGVLSSAGTVNLGGTAAGKAETNITVNNSISNNLLTSSAVSSEGGTINLTGTVEIKSDSLGITARGTINVGDETTQAAANVTVNTENATGVYVNNGTLSVASGATLDVTSTVRSNTQWVQPPEGQTVVPPSIYNGVYVNGGSLTSNGTLDVTFKGVQSDNVGTGNNQYSTSDDGMKSGTEYRDFKTKSYAVRVDDSENVTIAAGSITNSIGGGVLVNGGTVYLGTAGNTEGSTNHLAVSAMGNTYYGGLPIDGNGTDNWYYAPPEKGGDAVKVDGGTLYVYGGSYTASYGNGILVSNGTATVNGGTFTGNDNRIYGTSGLYTGAGSNYGLKVLGGSATVKGGTFSSNGGGVFIMGTPTEEGETPKVTTIEKATIDVTGATGVALWEYANVVFGTEDSTNNSDLSVRAESTGMTVEYTRDNARQNITIYSGTFESYGTASNKNGIWYGEGGATLTIKGGEFKGSGSDGRGLLIADDPGGKIEISGGTFVGGRDNNGTGGSAISGNSPGRITTGNIIASGSWCFDSEAVLAGNVTDETKRQHAICTYEFAWGTLDQYDYFQVGGGNSVNLTNNVSINGGDSRAFNTLGTIVVAIGDQITYRQ